MTRGFAMCPWALLERGDLTFATRLIGVYILNVLADGPAPISFAEASKAVGGLSAESWASALRSLEVAGVIRVERVPGKASRIRAIWTRREAIADPSEKPEGPPPGKTGGYPSEKPETPPGKTGGYPSEKPEGPGEFLERIAREDSELEERERKKEGKEGNEPPPSNFVSLPIDEHLTAQGANPYAPHSLTPAQSSELLSVVATAMQALPMAESIYAAIRNREGNYPIDVYRKAVMALRDRKKGKTNYYYFMAICRGIAEEIAAGQSKGLPTPEAIEADAEVAARKYAEFLAAQSSTEGVA